VYGTAKHRAEDLVPGDVIRNGYGKWDRVKRVASTSEHYVEVTFETGSSIPLRTVHLVDVQIVRPS
jgi:hypothetical protein